MTEGERRYFRTLGLVSVLSLATIGGLAAMERYLGPAWEVFPSVFSAPAQAQEPEAGAEPSSEPTEMGSERGSWPVGGGIPVHCVAALDRLDLEAANHSSRWLPPLSLDEDELGCFRFD